MNLRRILVLFFSDLKQSYNSFFFIFALVIPVILSLAVTALFGNLFSSTPKVAILDEGDSVLIEKFSELDSVSVSEYTARSELIEAVEIGVVDMGMVLPEGFDNFAKSDTEVVMDIFVYGGSLLKDRAILATSLIEVFRDIAGQEVPVEINTATIGEENIPWEDRLLPMIVLMSVVIGGFILPASSIVEEKQNRTLTAVTVAPASLNEVFVSKGAVGAMVSLLAGIITLLINNTWSTQPGLLMLSLTLGAIFAASMGVLLGAIFRDIESLFATVKGLGILLYAPGILYMFPNIPEWIAKVFPTYYIMSPVMRISQAGSGWADISTEIYILIALILVMGLPINWAANRLKMRDL